MPYFALDLYSFSVMVQRAPNLLARLLQEKGVLASKELTEQLRRFYAGITKQDWRCYQVNQHLESERVCVLATNASLAREFSSLPFSLYEKYCEDNEVAYNSPEGLRLSEEEVVFALTRGRIPLERYFYIEGVGYRYWDDEQGAIAGIRYEDINVMRDCEEFLSRRQVRAFRSREEVLQVAQAEAWRNWERATE